MPLMLMMAMVVQRGQYANQQGPGSDAVMLEVRSDTIEAGVQLALQQLVHPQQKWDIRKDVQVPSPPHGAHFWSALCTQYYMLANSPQNSPPNKVECAWYDNRMRHHFTWTAMAKCYNAALAC